MMSGEIHSGVQDITVSNDSNSKDDEDKSSEANKKVVSVDFSVFLYYLLCHHLLH